MAKQRIRCSYAISALLALAFAPAAFAQTVTTSASGKTFMPWDDYATQSLRDPWDMNQRTDIGWFTWGVDQPGSNMVQKKMTTDAFGQTIFSAVPATSDPSFYLLDPLFTSGASLGKIGSNFPINASKYTRLLVAMRMGGGDIKPPQFGIGGVPAMQVYFSRNSIFYDPTVRPTGGTYTTVDGNNNQVGTPFGPFVGGNCDGANLPCGSMEGGRYVIYSIPVGNIAAHEGLERQRGEMEERQRSDRGERRQLGEPGAADRFPAFQAHQPGRGAVRHHRHRLGQARR